MTVAGLLLLCVFAVSLLIGVPIAVAIALAAMAVVLLHDLPVVLLAHQMTNAAESYTLIAIPAFMLVGSLMSRAGLVQRMIDFSMALIGWVRGGLLQVSLIASTIFASISGSGTASTAAVGYVMIPSLIARGYSPGLAAAITSAGGSVGMIIPPSIAMIVYAVSANVSIPQLFLSGYIPGILVSIGFMALMFFMARRDKLGFVQKFSLTELGRAFLRSVWALLTPIIMVGGIVFGIVTPTESGIIGVVYVLFLGFVVHRELRLKDLYPAFEEALVLTAVVMFMLMTSALFGWVLARENIPGSLVNALLSFSDNKYVILFIINVLLLVLGALMEEIAILVILTPVLLPVATALQMDPVHFGLMVVFNLSIGLIAPPVGACLFVGAAIARAPIQVVIREIWPFILVSVAVLMLVTYVESVALLPRYVGEYFK